MAGKSASLRSIKLRSTNLLVKPALCAARENREGESTSATSGKPASKVSRVVVMSCARATNNKHCNKSSFAEEVVSLVRSVISLPTSGDADMGTEVVINDGSERIQWRRECG